MDEMMRVLVADNTPERKTICDALFLENMTVFEASDGVKATQLVYELMPDAVVLSIVLPSRDGLGILEHFARNAADRYPHFIVITNMGDAVKARSLSLGADAALNKPPDLAELLRLLRSFQGPSALALRHAETRLPRVFAQLREIGMPENLKGFSYLAQAVALVSVETRALRKATGFLYPYIAQITGASDHSVERAIRHAIETTWTRGSVDALHRAFGNSIDPQRGKPTNTECIAMLAQQLRGMVR